MKDLTNKQLQKAPRLVQTMYMHCMFEIPIPFKMHREVKAKHPEYFKSAKRSLLCRLGFHKWKHIKTVGIYSYYACKRCPKRKYTRDQTHLYGPLDREWLGIDKEYNFSRQNPPTDTGTNQS